MLRELIESFFCLFVLFCFKICTTLYKIHHTGHVTFCPSLGLTREQKYDLCMELYLGDNCNKGWRALAEKVGKKHCRCLSAMIKRNKNATDVIQYINTHKGILRVG